MSRRLGDSFPEADRRREIERRLRPGTVLYLFCQFTKPSPKDKYLLLLCTTDDNDATVFVINSKLTPFVIASKDLSQAHLALRGADCDFLQHDSYLNCGEANTSFSVEDIMQQLLEDSGRIRGTLGQDILEEVIAKVEQARTLSGKHKRMIVSALRSGHLRQA